MANLFKNIFRQIKQDLKLIYSRSVPVYTQQANEGYWYSDRKKFDVRMNSFQQKRLKEIRKVISSEGARSLLDVGAGDGSITYALQKEFLDIDIYATDYSEKSLLQLEKLGIKNFYLNLLCDNVSLPAQYDIICAMEVLEHLQNAENILLDLYSNAKKCFFFSVPNSGYWPYRLRLLMGRFPAQWRVHPAEHLRFWTIKDMRSWLDSLGLENKYEIIGYEGFKGLNYVFPNLFAMGMIVVVRK